MDPEPGDPEPGNPEPDATAPAEPEPAEPEPDGPGPDIEGDVSIPEVDAEAGNRGDDAAGGVVDEQEPPEGSDPLKFSKWMKRSATGAVMTGISIGLREALQTTKKEPAFMIEASGQPDDPDNPIQLHFDPDNPADTVAVIRQPTNKGDQTPPSGD